MDTRPVSMLPAPALVLVLALFSGVALAQFLYKSTMPDGKVIYGDGPMPGAVKVEKTKPDTSKKGVTAATPKEMEAAKKAASARGTGASADRAAELQAALSRLEAERDKVKEPREGERIGTAGGGTRFTDAYWERQKKYDESVDTIRKELDKARAGK